MSRIGKLPIKVPNEVQVTIDEHRKVHVKGPKGELCLTPHENIEVVIKNNTIHVKRKSNEKFDKSLHGLTRSLIANMIEGVSKGFEKQLIIQGVGYKAQIQAKKITLHLGFSHTIELLIPEGLKVTQDEEKKNILTIVGVNKQLVGDFSAKIRSLRPPEPYKGKGIQYKDERIIRKAGKAAVAKTPGGK